MGLNLSKRKKQTKVVKVEDKKKDGKTSMQSKLKQLYKQLNIPLVAWMGDRMELPIQQFYVKLKLTSSHQEIYHHEVFNDTETKRILIEGLPGYGKTTLATKIAYDWAINEEYAQRFHFVFLLFIREIRDKSVIDAIVDLTRISGFDKPEEVNRIIQKDEDNILLILDGLDEVAPNQREKILNILYRKEMTRMKVVVTCRSGEFTLKPSEGRALFNGLSIKTEFCDQQITILGIHNEDKVEFLTKFLHETELVDKVIEYLENITETAQEFFDSPLMLILLADMLMRGIQFGPTTTRTNFYKDVVNFMIRRSEERRNVFLSKSFNAFDVKNIENGSFKLKLQQFGYLCFKRVWDGNQLEFNEDELIEGIHQLGLVIIRRKLSNVTCTNYYQIYHRTILEFMAAYYIHQEFLHNNLIFPTFIQHKLVIDVYYHADTSMVTPFLIGLMKENASQYFLLMSSKYKDLFQTKRYALGPILQECECLTHIKNALLPNLPSEIDISSYTRYSSHICKRFVTLAVQSGKLQNIYIDWNDLVNLPKDIEFPNVHLCSEILIEGTPVRDWLKEIKCQRLYWYPFYTDDAVNQCFDIFNLFTAKVHIFDIENRAANHFLKGKDKWPESMEMKTLDCDFNRSIEVEEMCNLLDKCLIHKLVLKSFFPTTELSNILSHWKNVKHLQLIRCRISMDELFNNKQWENVELLNVQLTDPAIKDFYECKNVTLFNNRLTNYAFLSKISEISYLTCDYHALFTLMTSSSWQGFHTITQIDLSLSSLLPIENFDCTFWKSFNSFRNLEQLSIRNWCRSEIGVQRMIREDVLLLPIHELILEMPADMYNLSEHLSVVLKSVIVKSLKTLIIRTDWEYTLKNDEFLRYIDILQYCSEKNMSLKNISLSMSSTDKSNFEINNVSNVDIKYSFSELSFITVLLTVN